MKKLLAIALTALALFAGTAVIGGHDAASTGASGRGCYVC